MNKGLEALKYLKENKRKHWVDGDKSTECLDTIEKELKALAIIKKYFYGDGCLFGDMSKEEIDFIREVLL